MDQFGISGEEFAEELGQLRRRLAVAGLFLVGIVLVGTLGYWTIDPTSGVVDALYMTIITLTTVGFGEIVDLSGSPGGRMFTVALILVGMGAVLYFVTTATAFVIEGQLGHVFWRRRMQKAIDRLSDHLIICGSGSTAVYAAEELTAVRRAVVIVCENSSRVDRLQNELPDVPVVVGDPAADDVLVSAGIKEAAGLLACTDNDKENLVVTLSARQLNPGIRIVSRVSDVDSEVKIRKVGADAVVSPTHIGGLRLASELIRPAVVSFLDIMLRDKDVSLRVDEVLIPEGSDAAGRSIGELGIGQESNALLLACRRKDGGWEYNPADGMRVEAGDILVLLGSPDDVLAVSRKVGGEMVAKPNFRPA